MESQYSSRNRDNLHSLKRTEDQIFRFISLTDVVAMNSRLSSNTQSERTDPLPSYSQE